MNLRPPPCQTGVRSGNANIILRKNKKGMQTCQKYARACVYMVCVCEHVCVCVCVCPVCAYMWTVQAETQLYAQALDSVLIRSPASW